MAKHIKNIPCPKCRENGGDRPGDNLASYSDGSCYCWKCHYFVPGNNAIGKFLHKHNASVSGAPIRLMHLPIDACINYPERALTWLSQYEISRQDLLNNGVVWSDAGVSIRYNNDLIPVSELLIFPYWDKDNLIGWQGRYFGKDSRIPKWINKGKLQELYYIFLNGKGTVTDRHRNERLVIVEDVISALKVSKLGVQAMPIFGVNVKSRWHQIRIINPVETILWLDPDQYIKMIKECRVARLNGFKCHPILATKDPKEHTYDEIRKYLSMGL